MPLYALSDFSVLFPSGERALFKCQSYHSFPYWNIRIKCNTSQALFSIIKKKWWETIRGNKALKNHHFFDI
jgi:hypothetical protein